VKKERPLPSVLFVGDHPRVYWIGSSTLYIQQNLPEAVSLLEPKRNIILFVPHQRRKIISFLAGTLRRSSHNGYETLSGGIVSLLVHMIVHRYNVIHFFVIRNYMAWIILMAKLIKTKTIVTLHDTLFLQEPSNTMTHAVKMLMLKMSDRVLLLSHHDMDRCSAQKKPDRFRIVRNGISTVTTVTNVNHTNTALFGGGIGNEHAGLKFLESALSTLKLQSELEIYGTNTTDAAHRSYRGMVDRKDFHDAMRRSRITVVPSRYESFSMTALESLSLGIPVIVSDQCGISRYLSDEKDCLMVRYGDVDGLREKIQRLLTDDELWSRLSRNGAVTARNFLWKNVAPEYVAVYDELLEKM